MNSMVHSGKHVQARPDILRARLAIGTIESKTDKKTRVLALVTTT